MSYRAQLYFDSQLKSALSFIGIAIEMLRGTINVHDPAQNVLAHEDPNTADQRSITLTDCRNRTLWMLYMCDIYASANGRNRLFKDSELIGTPLPGQESTWHRSGGFSTMKRRATFGMNDVVTDLDIGEFGHVVRIVSTTSIFILNIKYLRGPFDRSCRYFQMSWRYQIKVHKSAEGQSTILKRL